jgi:hypothetical protein
VRPRATDREFGFCRNRRPSASSGYDWMASWIRRPDPSSNVGELDIDNAAAERAAGVVALVCGAGAATGFAKDVESCVELFVTGSFSGADTSPGFVNGAVEFAGAVVTVASAWDAGTSGSMTWDDAASRGAVVGAALSAAGSNPAKIIKIGFKSIPRVFMSNSSSQNFASKRHSAVSLKGL